MRAATVFLTALFAAGCSKEAPPPQRPPPQVTVLAAVPQTIPHVMSFVAQTESSRQVDIVARVSGFLDKLTYVAALDPIWVNFSVLYAENELFAADPLVPQPKEAVK